MSAADLDTPEPPEPPISGRRYYSGNATDAECAAYEDWETEIAEWEAEHGRLD